MNDECKKKCQIFTPKENVIQLLNWVGYKKNLYGKKIIENSCGDGQILIEIVNRYIKDCIKNNMDLSQIKIGLENDIYGAEIDPIHYKKCINNINNIARKYNIINVNWNIIQKDILKEKLNIKFDYVVGNPPYIKYKLLDEDTRKFVRENFEVCSIGKFDYCYAFIENGIKSLKENGKMAYLIPNSIFKNVFAQKLREYIKINLTDIYDYTTEKLFTRKNLESIDKDILTSSAVIIIDKNTKTKSINYHDIVNNREIKIIKRDLKDKWMFNKNYDIEEQNTEIKFGDYFKASNTIATLYNKAFVISNYHEEEEYIITKDNYKIEKTILREAVSPRSLNNGQKEMIIFPYYFKNGNLIKYTEEEMKTKFKYAYEYLNTHKKKLLERKSDISAKWYEYGRSQAISQSNKNKLLVSTVITKRVKVYDLSSETIPYSGIYITSDEENLNRAKEILESEEFLQYVKNIGINASGESIRITSKDINNYKITII
ncbi:MAG: SAM-dependent methyltransferase [Clostridia bacterium]|nr:SAM-dependent methyltransferase [Clostridia bacterium]